jgi:hypothetical protein
MPGEPNNAREPIATAPLMQPTTNIPWLATESPGRAMYQRDGF